MLPGPVRFVPGVGWDRWVDEGRRPYLKGAWRCELGGVGAVSVLAVRTPFGDQSKVGLSGDHPAGDGRIAAGRARSSPQGRPIANSGL